MANQKPIEKHDDNKWVKGFNRYSVISDILRSDSFDELKTTLTKQDGNSFYYDYNLLFQEFKLYNLVLDLEQDLCEGLYKLLEKNKIKNIDGIFSLIIEKTRRFRNLTKEDAEIILNKEITNEKRETSKKRLLTPHIIFYVAGMGLGDLIQLYKDYTINFDFKKDLVEKMSNFNQVRNTFTHNLLSSRVDINSLFDDGIKTGSEIKNILKPILEISSLD